MPNIPSRKRRWPDDEERVVDGANIVYSTTGHGSRIICVNEFPKEVHALMIEAHADEMLVLHHHSDPEVEVYIRNCEIMAIDARWEKVEEK